MTGEAVGIRGVGFVLGRVGFRYQWLSVAGSSFGGAIIQIATAWLALGVSGSAFIVGLVLAAGMLPELLFGLPAGAIADRYERRLVVATTTLASGVLAIAVGWSLGSGMVSLPVVLVAVFGLGALSTIRTAASQALAYDLVGRGHASTAIALTNLASASLGIIGGLVGGVLLEADLITTAFFVAGGANLFAAIAVLPCRARGAATTDLAPAALADGLRLVLRNRTVRALVILVAATEIFGFSSAALLPTFAQDVFVVGSIGLGLLVAAKSLGGVGGLVVVSISHLAGRKGRCLLLACVGLGVAIAGFAVSPVFGFAIAMVVVVGGAAAVVDTLAQTLLQDVVSDQRRGAAMGIWLVSVGLGPVGYLVIGAGATWFGAPVVQVVSGLMLIFIVAVIAVSPRIRALA